MRILDERSVKWCKHSPVCADRGLRRRGHLAAEARPHGLWVHQVWSTNVPL
jgi:hypothetical protein